MVKVPGYRPRRAFELVNEALDDTRIVVINGARQVGKSTLAQRATKDRPDSVSRYLDDAETRLAAEGDPLSFARHEGLMLIDEVQRVPDLWLTMKYLVDQDPRPGQFLLTGSARLLTMKELPDSLVGRNQTIELWPLSQGEIDSAPDGFVDACFAHGPDISAVDLGLRKRDYFDRMRRGGFPEAVRRESPKRRRDFFDSYFADIINRDVKQVADVRRASEVKHLISLLVGQVCGLVNYSALARRLDLNVHTVQSYIDILELIFLVRRIPAWSSGAVARTVSAPKIAFTDAGFAGHVAGGQKSDGLDGGLLENFVVAEIGKQATWAEERFEMFHFRDRRQNEVDLVLEDWGGNIIGIEVKAGETVRKDDLRGLELLRDRLGDRFLAGFVLYCGGNSLSFGDRLRCLPISALWTTEAPPSRFDY